MTSLLFRWFLNMGLMEPSFDPTVFTNNRRRLLKHDVAQQFFDEVVRQAADLGPLSDDHFSVDGTLIEAAARLKSFRAKAAQRYRPTHHTARGVRPQPVRAQTGRRNPWLAENRGWLPSHSLPWTGADATGRLVGGRRVQPGAHGQVDGDRERSLTDTPCALARVAPHAGNSPSDSIHLTH
jgi:Transposase domain (DUF772)